MADIDMIPRSYREAVRVRRTVRRAGAALACVAVLGIGAVGGVRWRGAALERQAAALEAAASRAQADRTRDATLQAAGMRLQRGVTALHALRREGELEAFSRALDAALTDQVWLTNLTLQRDAQGTPAKDAPADPAVEQVAPADAADGAPTWRLASTIEISGEATDYGAVTAFLATLARQNGVSGLRLVGSSAGADGGAIQFQATGFLARPKDTMSMP
ncbi:PilN domain-containing protein [Massilia sp. 9096]|uniref:PilN domain-containing protein n=1 Tax=Massilia sp. 9096 TaxID=1500894 RepID=UPI00056188BC|nr:PilN domain-containing protein [Massilia sp. 9096]